jgi:hypothetical protein
MGQLFTVGSMVLLLAAVQELGEVLHASEGVHRPL